MEMANPSGSSAATAAAAPPPSNPTRAAKPTRTFFDPWNSSSTGHQRAENRLSGSTSWRDSRTSKLAEQLRDGQRGGKRMSDTVGAGSEAFGQDGRLENGGWAVGASGLRKGGQQSLWESFDARKRPAGSGDAASGDAKRQKRMEGGEAPASDHDVSHKTPTTASEGASSGRAPPAPPLPQIFRGVVFYLNGSTYPLVSDHKLKKTMTERGARMSIALGRRTVTHVILGTSSREAGAGAGGGLAGGKIQKEIAAVRGAGVKFVGVEWVLESVRAGKRLPEAGFANLKLAAKAQGSVYGLFKATKSTKA